MLVAGIDPGSSEWRISFLENGKHVCSDSEVCSSPQAPVHLLERNSARLLECQLIAAPSGFGLPLTRVEELNEQKLFEVTLQPPSAPSLLGLRKALNWIREQNLPAVILPGVKHLPTVPAHRKLGRIDIGTADKVAATAFALAKLWERNGVLDHSFLLAEVGSHYTAFVVVEEGEIVDGVGGANVQFGWQAAGCLDSELAVLVKPKKRDLLRLGAVAYGANWHSPHSATEAFLEGIIRTAAGLLAVHDTIDLIICSGLLGRRPEVLTALTTAAAPYGASVTTPPSPPPSASEASLGAAILADGLCNGVHAPVVETLRIAEARGSVFDYFPHWVLERIRLNISI